MRYFDFLSLSLCCSLQVAKMRKWKASVMSTLLEAEWELESCAIISLTLDNRLVCESHIQTWASTCYDFPLKQIPTENYKSSRF